MLLGAFPLGLHPLGFIPGGIVPPPPVVLPNGRWRSVADPSYIHFLNPITDLIPARFEVGFTLYFDSPNLPPTLLSGMELVLVKPSGAQIVVPRGDLLLGNDPIAGQLAYQRNWIAYIFRPGDLNEPGVWGIYVRRDGVALSGLGSFPVT